MHTAVLIAHQIGIEVVAKGVETTTQEAILKGCGCNAVQGYLYSKAVSWHDFAEQFKPRVKALD